MKLGIDFKDPSTYCGIIAAIGSITSYLSAVPSLSHVAEILTAVSGLCFVITKNYSNKPQNNIQNIQ